MTAYVVITKTRTRNQSELELYAKYAPAFMAGHPATYLARHELHFIDASDDVCKRQLRDRSRNLPAGTAWTTDAEFDAITAYFEAPASGECFNVIRHERA